MTFCQKIIFVKSPVRQKCNKIRQIAEDWSNEENSTKIDWTKIWIERKFKLNENLNWAKIWIEQKFEMNENLNWIELKMKIYLETET
jgi:hypothetical protein